MSKGMRGALSPEDLQLLIAGYVLCDLSAEEADILEQLMADDPAIAAEVAKMQQVLEITYAPPEVAPPSHLRSTILAAHQTADPTPASSPLTIAPPQLAQPSMERPHLTVLPRWVKGLGAIAAAAIVGLSLSNYLLWRSLQAAQRPMPAAEALTVSLQPTEAASDASVQVTIDPASLEGRLQVENLPPLPPGQVYVLWTVLEPNAPFTVDQKGAILTQVFTVDDQGQQVETLTVPVVYRDRQWVRAIAITVEDADAPQQHVSNPLLIQPL